MQLPVQLPVVWLAVPTATMSTVSKKMLIEISSSFSINIKAGREEHGTDMFDPAGKSFNRSMIATAMW